MGRQGLAPGRLDSRNHILRFEPHLGTATGDRKESQGAQSEERSFIPVPAGSSGPPGHSVPILDSFPEHRGPWCPRAPTLRSEAGPLLEGGPPWSMVGSCPILTQEFTPAMGLCKVRRKDSRTNRAAGETQNKDASTCPPLGVFQGKDGFQGPLWRRGWKRGLPPFLPGQRTDPPLPNRGEATVPLPPGPPLPRPPHRPFSPPASRAPEQLFKGR